MKKILLAVILIVLIGISYFFVFNNTYQNTATLGIIIDKQQGEDYKITLWRFVTEDYYEEMEIIVKDENLWNLIEIERSYFISYDKTNSKGPILTQIMINDEYKNQYSKYLTK